ncbi:Y-family DNA polymerase [Parabacteroides sp. GYB001]|uniref:Y-family DNA polymerase n=1 Tax=Parabacteroides leei TaxID=2939491 RepID=UPI002017109E|nr:Y-family DNA polymerase [Parabacteroides leei]MCL3854163.1 Y-family DNA polymerase [Parabacteroides leei]
MIALADCNSFFCSVEKVFHPGLDGMPVCVLSCNDGCIVALTPEAKAIGLHRGDPIFKMRDIVEHNNVKLFSTNMYLYAAMSKRVNNILRSAIPHTESYSIDESFLYLDGMEKLYNLEEYMRGVAEKVKLYTDIPVSVGVAPSKTLAKMGSKFAKQYKGYQSVCMIDNEDKRRKALELFELADVWGIGRQTLAKLNYLGIHTPLEFADKKENWVRSHFNLPGVQTWKELNGIPCIDTAEVAQKQSISTSRSFGEMVTSIDSLRASVADFAASCANKLRGQHSVASTVTVYIMSNRFREDLSQYGNGQTAILPIATSDTIEITKAALSVLDEIYREGISYKKAGVILGNITDASVIQQNLFDEIKNRPARFQLMKSIDNLNHRYGLKTLRLAVEGGDKQEWHAKSEHRSGNYLSDINEILTIRI